MGNQIGAYRLAAVIVLLGGLAGSTVADVTPPAENGLERVLLVRATEKLNQPLGVSRLRIDPDGYDRMWHSGRTIVTGFPLPDRAPVDLELTPFTILSPEARLIVVDEQGERAVAAPEMRFFRGRVAGDADSLVALTLFDGRIAGFVRTWDDEFDFAPMDYSLARPRAHEIRIASRRLAEEPLPGPFCDLEEGEGVVAKRTSLAQRPAEAARTGRAVDENTLLKAFVAIDATVEWFNFHGSLTAAQNYILNLMAQVSAIYESAVLVRIEVPFLRVFTAEPDPYTDGSTSTAVLLDDLRTEWNANQTSVARTAAHVFSIQTSGGSGRAYIDVLCDNDIRPGSSYDYGVAILSASGASYEKVLVAHEIGHNFSSPHTHCYAPVIDRCYNSQSGCYSGVEEPITGTIMSYCDDRDPLFHARAKDEQIRPAAEAAFPTCIDTAGSPAEIRQQDGSELNVSRALSCPSEGLTDDDGSLNSYFGGLGTAQLTWIKRFTPSCYPFQLDRIEILIGHSPSVSTGRAIRLVTYVDPSGSGNPVNAFLASTEETTIQVVSSSTFNQYNLAEPVIISSGDLYIGAYDLVADATDTYIATVDTSLGGDAFRAFNSTDPNGFGAYASGTWMIRGAGGPLPGGSLYLDWGLPCNAGDVPGQDFGIYVGSFSDFSSYARLTCTTNRETTHLVSAAPDDSFFLVVPSTTAAEGSYGLDGDGQQRPPAALPCNTQAIGDCP